MSIKSDVVHQRVTEKCVGTIACDSKCVGTAELMRSRCFIAKTNSWDSFDFIPGHLSWLVVPKFKNTAMKGISSILNQKLSLMPKYTQTMHGNVAFLGIYTCIIAVFLNLGTTSHDR